MIFKSEDKMWMERALKLAARGLYSTTPNPRVGCVITKNNVLISEGWHKKAGGDHAEVMALKSAGTNARGSTVYITLEPCDHVGRTGPCTDALISAGVTRVVCAMVDPNPLIRGSGLSRLRHAGIKITMDVLREAAENINKGFITRMTLGRPFIRIKIAAGLDGKTALENGVSKWITSKVARRDVHAWRAQSCGILTGVGTLSVDNPQLNVRLVDTQRQPLRIVVDSRLRVPVTSKIFEGGDVLLFTASEDYSKFKIFEDLGAEVVSAPNGEGKVDLVSLAKELGRRQLNEIMTEAGSRLHTALFYSGLFDELLVYYAPKILGSEGRSMLDLNNVLAMDDVFKLKTLEVMTLGPDVRVRAVPQKNN